MKKLLFIINLIQGMDGFISNRNTGPPKKFGEKTCCSKRTCQTNIEDFELLLKSSEVKIPYNFKDKTYEYSKQGHFLLLAMWIPEINSQADLDVIRSIIKDLQEKVDNFSSHCE